MTDAATRHDGYGPVSASTLSRIQQIGGKRLQLAWTQIPHVTHHDEADITLIDALRQERRAAGAEPLSVLAYVTKACIQALREFPRFCASLDSDGKTLWLKQYLNLGFAIDTNNGLLVAVASAVERKSIEELGAIITDLATRSRAGQLKPTELEGSCFTVTSLGKLGGLGFSPIINVPNVAILGVSDARIRPQWIDGTVAPRLMLPLSLSYDHRVIDGAEAGRFCTFLTDILADTVKLGA